MSFLQHQAAKSPLIPRVVPFAIFLLLTSLQGQLGETSPYWLYLVKTLLGAWMLWAVRDLIAEMKWAFSWEAVVAGVAVFALWVGLDGFYPDLKSLFSGAGSAEAATEPELAWNPQAQFGSGSLLAWLFIGVRIGGSTLVVPMLEEVFYRSFVYRYLASAQFEKIELGRFLVMPFFVTSILFGLAHFEWLPGILCGMIYQLLVIRKKRLGDAMTAHAITNLLLGIWVVTRGAWNFW